jgi:hypothetical protein
MDCFSSPTKKSLSASRSTAEGLPRGEEEEDALLQLVVVLELVDHDVSIESPIMPPKLRVRAERVERERCHVAEGEDLLGAAQRVPGDAEVVEAAVKGEPRGMRGPRRGYGAIGLDR